MSIGYNRDRNPLEPPSLTELLDCPMTYPEGTRGHADEEILISTLHGLCLEHGFGRVSQLVEAVDAIWRKSKKADRLVRLYTQHREFMRGLATNTDSTADTRESVP